MARARARSFVRSSFRGQLLQLVKQFPLSYMTSAALSQMQHIQRPGYARAAILPYSLRSENRSSLGRLLQQAGTMFIQRRIFCGNGGRSRAGDDGVLQEKDDQFVRYTSPEPSSVEHAAEILACPETKVTVLPNGLRVATESYPGSLATATIGLWIDSGSRFDSDSTSGTAHFVQHMLFKGTTRRSCDELGKSIEAAGAKLSATISREETSLVMRILQHDALFAVDVLADIVLNSTFSPAVIEQEQETILRGFKKVQSENPGELSSLLHATAFQHCPLGRPITGYAETVVAITRPTLKRYVAQHLTASRMVLVAVGPVDHQKIVKLAESFFKALHATRKTARHWIDACPTVFTGSEVRIKDDDLPYVQLAIAFKSASWTDPDSTALMVLESMLGHWTTDSITGKHAGSKLAQKVAADSLAECVMAFNTPYSDGGLFGIYAVTKEDALEDLSETIMLELGKLTREVDDGDVLRAKAKLKSNLALQLADTFEIANVIGHQLLTYGRRVSLTELFARIDGVDATTVKRVAKRFFHDKDLAIASMGPIQKLPDYSWFRRHPCWLR